MDVTSSNTLKECHSHAPPPDHRQESDPEPRDFDSSFTLLVIAACSSNGDPTAPTPSQTEQALVEDIRRLNSQLASLRQEVKELRKSADEEENQLTRQPEHSIKLPQDNSSRESPDTEATPWTEQSTAVQRSTSTPSPSPEPTAPPTSITAADGVGICNGTPEVQQAILTTLRINSCRLVTNEELYRITRLTDREGRSVGTHQWQLKRET